MSDKADADFVKATYEDAWSDARAAIEAEIAAGETALSRLVHRSFPNIGGKRAQPGGVSRIFHADVPAPFLTARRISRDWMADTVIEHAAQIDADAIVEMGSGFGYNLCNIWLRGGPRVPHHAFEYTEAGRQACLRLREAATEGPDLTAHAFDYYAADFSDIRGRYRRPLFYSSHSIEQINELPQSFIDAVLGVAPQVSVIHFEPVGWQIEPDHAHSQRQRTHCERNLYNANLWSLLQHNQAAGALRIEAVEVNVMAAKIYNGSTMIRWSRGAPSG